MVLRRAQRVIHHRSESLQPEQGRGRAGGHTATHTNPLDQPPGGQFLSASVSWSEKGDQRTQSKKASSRKRPIPSPAPRGWRVHVEPSWEKANHPPPTLFSCLTTKPSHLPSESKFCRSRRPRRRAGCLQGGGVCVCGALWLEAKAILAGSGPVCSARGLSRTGRGVRYSQPRAKPSNSCVPHLPVATHL